MTAPAHISNPTEAHLATYAAANGYKELRETEAPSIYHTRKYREYDEYITSAWYAPSLDELKDKLKAKAEETRDAALAATTTIEVEGVGGVIYNAQAVQNITAWLVKQKGGAYILADDSVVTLSLSDVALISDAFEDHVMGIYATKTAAFAAIEACETVEDLLGL